jgi:hypothetical protein
MQPFLPLHDRAPQLSVVTTSPGACPKHAPHGHARPRCPVNDARWTRRPPPSLPRSSCCLPSLSLCTCVRARRRRFIEQLAGPTRRDRARQARTPPTPAPLQNHCSLTRRAAPPLLSPSREPPRPHLTVHARSSPCARSRHLYSTDTSFVGTNLVISTKFRVSSCLTLVHAYSRSCSSVCV